MGSPIKVEELEVYRRSLEKLRARLLGDLDQLTDEALKWNQPEAAGNLSNLPLHMADVGTENYDQEFTLGLIENDQTTIGEINEAIYRIEQGRFGLCEECSGPVHRNRLQAIPYTRHCIDCARKLENQGS